MDSAEARRKINEQIVKAQAHELPALRVKLELLDKSQQQEDKNNS